MSHELAIAVLKDEAIHYDNMSIPEWDRITQELADECKDRAIQLRATVKYLQEGEEK